MPHRTLLFSVKHEQKTNVNSSSESGSEEVTYLFSAALAFRCCPRALSSCSEQGLLFLVASHCGGFSSGSTGSGACGLQWSCLEGPRPRAQQLWCAGSVAPRHVGSSPTRGGTRVSTLPSYPPRHPGSPVKYC